MIDSLNFIEGFDVDLVIIGKDTYFIDFGEEIALSIVAIMVKCVVKAIPVFNK